MVEHTCESPDCNNQAKLRCPTCIKKDIEGGFYCSQNCFKACWTEHKKKHATTTLYDPFPKYHYTGTLRPVYPLSPKREVPSHIEVPDYAESGYPTSEMNISGDKQIEIISGKELELCRKACEITREVLEAAGKIIKPGITTDEIDRVVHEETIKRDAYPSPLNYMHYPKSVCTSVNECICHGIPDNRKLEDGDIINIDVSCYYKGFHGDSNKTFLVGNVDANGRKLVDVTKESLKRAIAIVKPGVLYREIGNVIEKYVKSNGFSVVRTYCGHGVHRHFHCPPTVCHYAKNKTFGVMKPGHIFTIEPMINEGSYKDTQWPDDWTAVTVDGKRSAQFEHTILVTENGCEVLTAKDGKW